MPISDDIIFNVTSVVITLTAVILVSNSVMTIFESIVDFASFKDGKLPFTSINLNFFRKGANH